MAEDNSRKPARTKVVKDGTSDIAVSVTGDKVPEMRPVAASTVLTDEEAGAAPNEEGRIEPIIDTPPPSND